MQNQLSEKHIKQQRQAQKQENEMLRGKAAKEQQRDEERATERTSIHKIAEASQKEAKQQSNLSQDMHK